MTHVSMRYLSKEETVKDLRESKAILEEHMQKQVDYYAFPYGQKKDFGHATPELLQEIGFKAAFTTLWKRNNLRENPYRLRRVEVRPTDTMDDFQRYLIQKPDFRFLKQQIKNVLR
jgi:peptidoglycan/xylan/chitin deacetylase (PgdA/CDA1 family)